MASTQTSIEQQLATITSGGAYSDQKLRMLLVELILTHLEGNEPLSFVLTSVATIYHHMNGKLAPDLLTAITVLAELADQVNTKRPESFIEQQKIEDQLVSILHQLQK